MSNINTGGPAFPIPLNPGQSWKGMAPCDGMTLRQYAAIKLKVPDSGSDWLDGMIRESLRNDFAAKAMQGLLSATLTPNTIWSQDDAAEIAYNVADAMLKARGE